MGLPERSMSVSSVCGVVMSAAYLCTALRCDAERARGYGISKEGADDAGREESDVRHARPAAWRFDGFYISALLLV